MRPPAEQPGKNGGVFNERGVELGVSGGAAMAWLGPSQHARLATVLEAMVSASKGASDPQLLTAAAPSSGPNGVGVGAHQMWPPTRLHGGPAVRAAIVCARTERWRGGGGGEPEGGSSPQRIALVSRARLGAGTGASGDVAARQICEAVLGGVGSRIRRWGGNRRWWPRGRRWRRVCARVHPGRGEEGRGW